MDEIEYDFDCDYCEAEITVIIHNIDEKPSYCPMCGTASDEGAWG